MRFCVDALLKRPDLFMRYLLLICFTWLSSLIINDPAAGDPNAICGKWMSAEKNLAVEVYRNKQAYRAKIIYFTGGVTKDKPMEAVTDIKNPDPALRNRKVLGLNVLEGLSYAKPNAWEGGKIYEVQSGKYWNAAAYLDKNGQLKVKGYWHMKLIGRTMTFNRM